MTTEITHNIVKLINESFERAIDLAEQTRSKGEAAITEAQHCGRLLEKQQRSLPYGQWGAWLEANCPKISYDTARRWILLAHVQELKGCTTMRQAYIAAGILPEPEKAEPTPTLPKPDEGLLYIQRACQYFNKHDLLKMNDVGRSVWKDRLRPLVELYEKL